MDEGKHFEGQESLHGCFEVPLPKGHRANGHLSESIGRTMTPPT